MQQKKESSIHFYMGNLNNMRKHLFPGLLKAYEDWRTTGDIDHLHQAVEAGKHHWQQAANDTLMLAQVPKAQEKIAELLESRQL